MKLGMKINISYTDEMIRELIKKDLESKLNFNVMKKPSIEIKVRSRQNYRDKEWESGELKCDLEVDI
jgi:hypothetical protein